MNPPRPHTVSPWDLNPPEGAPVWTIAILKPQSTLVENRPAASTVIGQARRRPAGPFRQPCLPGILLLGVAVLHQSQSPFHQRQRLFMGMVQQNVHFRHLWGGQLVLAVHICKVLQPACPCLAGQSPFCLSINLMGSLDQHCSSPSFAWSVHTMDARYHLRGNTQSTDDPQGSPCAWCILLTPLGLIPHESWFWVVPRHSTAWLDWFPYSVETRRNTSDISKGNVLGYYRNLGSLKYENEYCVPGHAMSCTLGCFLLRNRRCSGRVAYYMARRLSYFGGLWRAA